MALCAAAQEAIALRALVGDFGVNVETPTTIYEDNQGALAMAYNPVHYAKTKHIHIRFHFIREQVKFGNIRVEYIPTDEMLADALTKPLASVKFNGLVNLFLSNWISPIFQR